MSFDWKSYHALAEQLSATTDTPTGCTAETLHRAAISRAYYAVFNLTVDYLKNRNFTLPSKDKHQFVIDRMDGLAKSAKGADVNVTRCRTIVATNLPRLRGYRNNADYDGELHTSSQRLVVITLKQAKNCIEALELLLAS
jgi:uncharacterized protein (UPF0332 family)